MTFRLLLALALCLIADHALAGGACNEGCTPGYWKQTQHFGSWTAPYTPATRLRDVFVAAPVGLIPDDTLLDALNYNGSPGVDVATRILLRMAAATPLKAPAPNAEFPASVRHAINTTISRIGTRYRPRSTSAPRASTRQTTCIAHWR